MPDDPRWQDSYFREYLAVTMPGERRVCWLADDADGVSTGYTSLLLLEDIAVVELYVRPGVRRGHVGSLLLEAAAQRAAIEGYESLGVEVVGGTHSVEFFESHGFRCAFVEMRNVLDLGGVDWPRIGEMANIGAGYRIEYHPGGPPADMLAGYAEAKETARTLDAGDLELRPSSYNADRLRASLATLHARGMKPYIVLAVHESSEQIVGLTEVVVPAQRPTRADQYDTVVVPKHGSYGIDRALKARMLFELRAAEPGLREVQTWNDVENDPMWRVNSELGFKADREW